MHVKTVCIIGLLTFSVVYGKPWYCGEQDCPTYTTTYSRSYDIREYDETKWVASTIQTSKPYCSTKQLRELFAKIYPYYQGANSQGKSVSIAVPAMNRVQEIRDDVYNITMMWYLPGNPPTPTAPGVFLVTRPAGEVYVYDFQARRWPSDKTFVTKYKQLKRSVGSTSLYKPGLFYRVSYNYPFDRKKKQHEVWLDMM